MKKKLQLSTVLKIKAHIEKSITSSYEDILKYNFTSVKVDVLLDKISKYEQQLIHLKEVIQEANKGKLKGVTNNYNIYHLSNLNAKLEFYKKLKTKFYCMERAKKASKAQLTKEFVLEQIETLTTEINEIQNKLSEFNSKKKVTVYLDDDLKLDMFFDL